MHSQSKFKSLLLAGALISGSIATVEAVPGWTIDQPDGFRNGSWAFGELFTVGSSNITIDSLGAIDIGLDGFRTVGGVPVGIFNSAGSLLASTFVQSGDALIGNYRFASISELVLNAGEQYRVVGVNRDDLYNIAENTPSSVNALVTWDSYAYGASTSLEVLNSFTGTERSWFANIGISDAEPRGVPDTGSTLRFFAVAVAAIAAGRRKRR